MEKPKSHPMIEQITRLLRKKEDGTYSFDPQDLERFKKEGLAIEDPDDLYLLVDGLVMLGYVLDVKQGSPEAAAVLLDMATPLADRLSELTKDDPKRGPNTAAIRKHLADARKALKSRVGGAAGLKPGAAAIGVGLRKRR